MMGIRRFLGLGKAFFIVCHLFLLTLFSYVVADLTGFLIGEKLVVYSKPTDSSVSLPRKNSVSLDQYKKIILEGNLFNPEDRGKVLEEFVAREPIRPISLPPLNLKLIGTVVGEPADNSFAIIEDQKTKEQNLYRLNQTVLQDARLVSVQRDRVTLLRGETEEILPLYEEEDIETPQQEGSPSGGEQISGVRPVAGNRWVLDKREVSQAFENLPQLLTKARIIPNFTKGKADGFRIVSIVPNSIYEKIGLQNGDILQRINGVEIKDPQSFLNIFQQLKDETSISLDLVRNNQKTSFGYEIR